MFFDRIRNRIRAWMREIAFASCRAEGLHVFKVQQIGDRHYLIDRDGQCWRVHADGK